MHNGRGLAGRLLRYSPATCRFEKPLEKQGAGKQQQLQQQQGGVSIQTLKDRAQLARAALDRLSSPQAPGDAPFQCRLCELDLASRQELADHMTSCHLARVSQGGWGLFPARIDQTRSISVQAMEGRSLRLEEWSAHKSLVIRGSFGQWNPEFLASMPYADPAVRPLECCECKGQIAGSCFASSEVRL